MIPYFIALFLPAGLLYIVDRYSPERRIALALVYTALLIPCVIAGARDSGIGLDTLGYGDQVYYIAVRHAWEWNAFLDEVKSCGFDIGIAYSLMSFFVVGLTGSKFFYYLIIELFILVPLYYSLRLISPGKNRALSYSVIYLLFYMLSLSAMRQFIALSIGFLSVAELIKNGYSARGRVVSACCAIISILFHSSAAFILICHISWILGVGFDGEVPKFRKYSLKALPLIGLFVISMTLFIDPIFRAATDMIPFFKRYASYLVTSGTSDGFTFFIFFSVMIASATYLGRSLIQKRDPRFIYLLSFSVISLVIYSLQTYNEEFIRLSYYFWPFIAALFLTSFGKLEPITDSKNKNLDIFAVVIYLAFCFGQFAWWYLINDYWNCLPYSSSFF